MKTFFFFFIFGLNAYGATMPSGCGTFDIYGIIEKNKTAPGYSFLVNKGSLSEYKFQITDEEEIKAAPYINRPIKMKARILKKITDYHGEFDSVLKYEYAVIDPANLKKLNGFSLVKKEKCK